MARQLQAGKISRKFSRTAAGDRLGQTEPRQSRRLWFEKLMAILALLNLVLVLFDLSYIPWRDLYLRHLPQFTERYGERFKGIEPHQLIAAYLAAVEDLKQQVALTGLQSPKVAPKLAQLQALSLELVTENPFAASERSGTLERIKNRDASAGRR